MKSKTISFMVTPAERTLINRIVDRAMGLKVEGYDRMDCMMDVNACHANGCPLDLKALLNADDFNFAHDVLGIARHINRTTGQLENCFVPRFSKPGVTRPLVRRRALQDFAKAKGGAR